LSEYGIYPEGVAISKPRVARHGELPWGQGQPTIYPDRGCIRLMGHDGWDQV
jgi:hypothetical protein